MKTPIYIILLFIFSIVSCNAQSPVLPLYNQNEIINGAYYKDTENELDKFVGTWINTNGNTSLTVIFEKKLQVYNDEWYEDLLIGEYRYTVNGREIVNTFLDLNIADPNYHSIAGNEIIFKNDRPSCSECTPTERRILMFFDDSDPQRKHLSSYLAIRYVDVNGLEKIEAKLVSIGTTATLEGSPTEPRVPYGDYVLVKQ
ncbi:DUF6705 family protein [Bizionia myxarmorum]|uniref:DUF6705 domain-containing protein n=1 Tax=Bizionia myxarmorum TaxID=291186 RepID=A0A5D0RBI5_9FLAO|nr:DUF6705 family protein [Bizionia myxarmorum]TYB78449.1 hypothetical protein ES674_01315 [Bizionia myxarmorum]